MGAPRVFIVDKPATQIESNGANDVDAPGILDRLIRQAETSGASDIHLQMRGSSAEVSFRLDGVINRVSELPEKIAPLVFGRIKFLARLKTYQESLPQDGRIDKADAGSQNDIRVATYPTVTGEKIVLRLFNSSSAKSIRELAMAAEICKALETYLRQTSGMMLLTGPAGSGKTTTIYACLRELATTGGRQIITVEDPVEQIVPGVMQTEVNEALGLDFAKAARHLLRQDPQALVIGEIRDEETANIAVRAALTGHLVISTLHAGSCRGVFERLLVLCKDHAAVASSLELVLNQRLARTLCASCAGKGCGECLNTGYHGRAPIVEWWGMQETVRRQIILGDTAGIRPQHTHFESARALLRENLTNRAEVSRVLGMDVAEIDAAPSL